MLTIDATATVGPDHRAVLVLPPGLPPGDHRMRIAVLGQGAD